MADNLSGWIYEAGIGENRAMLMVDGEVHAIRLERPGNGVRAGDIVNARFTRQWVPGKSGIATLENGEQCLVQPLAAGVSEGAELRLQITRPAWQERGGQSKCALARPAPYDADCQIAPDLLAQLKQGDRQLHEIAAHGTDIMGQWGWDELMDQADSGQVDFDGGRLLISLTPAMTVIDIDGPLPPRELALRAAGQVARALTLFDIGGSVAIDFPTLENKTDRQQLMARFDDVMTTSCERTAINGFGLMQVVSRRSRPSLLEIRQADPVLNAALDLLRRAEREPGTGKQILETHPAVAAKFEAQSAWLDELSRRTGRSVTVTARGDIPIHASQFASG